LIRSGPYARLRNPIYTGLDLAALGGLLAIDEWRCLAGVCLVVTGYVLKALRENSLLAGQFGAAWAEHKRLTGFLFPKLTRSKS
jgi:protein-S-isoprenylcysteine O-methyltransferase Ste14